ncbi:hypothetical protein [Deinococcus sp.]|uniref:hypothetical protein n=1 Tax=Deinococcus sp. TaxID=47478 RepID=UPI0025D44C20|nr:hypothetical protein [Deinococcus sp.]
MTIKHPEAGLQTPAQWTDSLEAALHFGDEAACQDVMREQISEQDCAEVGRNVIQRLLARLWGAA